MIWPFLRLFLLTIASSPHLLRSSSARGSRCGVAVASRRPHSSTGLGASGDARATRDTLRLPTSLLLLSGHRTRARQTVGAHGTAAASTRQALPTEPPAPSAAPPCPPCCWPGFRAVTPLSSDFDVVGTTRGAWHYRGVQSDEGLPSWGAVGEQFSPVSTRHTSECRNSLAKLSPASARERGAL